MNPTQSESDLLRKRLAASQRIAMIGDWESDLNHVYLRCSDQAYEIFGVVPGDPSRVAEMFADRIHPDDLEMVRNRQQTLSPELLRITVNHRITHPDGEVRRVQQRSELILDDAGRPSRIIGTIQDISEQSAAEELLRNSQERFRLVAKTIGEVIWDWNLCNDSVWRSDGFENKFGLAASEANEMQTTWERLIHDEDRDRVAESLQTAINGTSQTWSEEYRVLRRDSSYASVEDRAQIIRNADGKALRVVGGIRDLTDQKNFAARLLRSQRMESIGVLAGGIAHDLNNVLAPILMSIDILKQNSRGKERSDRMLDIVRASAQRGADLVRQVLTFSKGADGENVVVSFKQLFNELEKIVKETFPSNIEIEFDASAKLWPVLGDPSQFHQVLLNLAVNARDAMPNGGTMQLSAKNKKVAAALPDEVTDIPVGCYVELVAKDSGTGMTPEVCDRIFEAFFTTKGAGKGTGLGLTSVYAIVKKYHGFTNVVSKVGKGTTFTIHFPVDPELRTETTAPMVIDNQRGNGETVLLIDDERSIRDIAKQTLEGFGYHVLVAGDGIEGIALYVRNAEQIGVVITDMMMPNCDGRSTIRVLVGINPDVRIIAASGLEFNRDGGTEVTDFLAKPYSAESMLKLIREVLDRP